MLSQDFCLTNWSLLNHTQLLQMKTFIITLIHIVLFATSSAQQTLQSNRITEEVSIDGLLTETFWETAEVATDFITWQPVPGRKATLNSQIKIAYDDEAIYIGAIMSVPSRDSIMTELTQRDDVGNTDFFGVFIDTYGNGTDAFEFIISATGVQFDAKLSDHGEDNNWDAVWFSEVHLTDTYWSTELKIPYSAIRFSKDKIQKWKMNFIRRVASTGERTSWVALDPEAPVFLAQMGEITGIHDIKAPLRLSISPYLSTYVQNHSDKSNGINSTGFSYNGGMDLKYGINDAFTLDMTLIPDFGQVQSDNLVLNLSPFEQRYDERRQFFTEGIELFTKGNLFYSRRVGGSPIGQYAVFDKMASDEELVSNPSTSKLINATKVSGRTSKGMGIGIFNAVAKSTYALVKNTNTGEERRIETAPLTNYNVFTLDQNLKNNSSISLVNTNVWRAGNDYYDANVTAGLFDLKVAKQKIGISGGVAVSQKFHSDDDNEVGLRYELDIEKLSGNFTYGISYEQKDEKFDPNDMGFQFNNNERSINVYSQYQINKPFGNFNRAQFWFNYTYSRLVNPDKYYRMHFNGGLWMQTKEFLNINLWTNFRPRSNNFYEPREWGRFFEEPTWGNLGFWMGTDNRKKLRIRGYILASTTDQPGQNGFSYSVSPRYRFNDKFNMTFEHELDRTRNKPRYVDRIGEDIIFGKRMQTTIENSLRFNYSFTDKMGLDFRLRHYWSKVDYNGFNMLTELGELGDTDYNAFNDFTFNLFNIDLNFTWRFASGSDIIINWKNNISGVMADESIDYSSLNYFKGIESLNDFPQDNSISLRVIYYLDYQQIKKAF